MLWIKRNLFLAIGGIIAVLLLGFGIFYALKSRGKNKQLETQLEENKNLLTRLVSQDPYPNLTNINRAKEEVQRVRQSINQSKMFFQPVPFTNVMGQAFKTLLDTTIFELHRKAEQLSVVLPSKTYAFTFTHQKTDFRFPPEAFPALPQQLAEIKTLCEMLFDAKVNKLITLRRSRLYAEEPVSQVDHHDMKPTLNDQMGMAANPYEIVFHSFSMELATVLESFYRSTNGFIVKAVAVDIAPAAVADPNAPPGAAPPPAVAPPLQRVPPPQTRVAPGFAAPKPAALRTVLNEKLLRITLVMDVVRTMETNKTAAAALTWNR
jgi:hypothetical protein